MCIMWGWQGASVNLGKIDRLHCPICEKEQDFILSMTYKYGNVFWIPLFSWGNEYIYHCQVCQRGFKMHKKGYQLYPIYEEETTYIKSCPQCGKEQHKKSQFCTSCGTNIGKSPVSKKVSENPKKLEPWVNLTAAPNSLKPWYHRYGWLIPAGLLAALLLGTWIYENLINPPAP